MYVEGIVGNDISGSDGRGLKDTQTQVVHEVLGVFEYLKPETSQGSTFSCY